MPIPRHLGHHEAARELPLVTDSATVTPVEAMDRNRVRAARAVGIPDERMQYEGFG